MNTFIKKAQALTRKADLFLSKNGQKNFHRFAAESLQNAQLEKFFDYEELAQGAFEQKMFEIQYYKFSEFSDLPLTIARGRSCFIDIYFWRRRPTVIHNHHFVGAFQCLAGSNVDLEFQYNEEKKLGRFHGLGQIQEPITRHLKKGGIAEINYLNKFIHQNHHQADLTVNLCFRIPEKKNTHISNFLFTGLRYEKSPALLARVQRLIKFAGIDDFKWQKIDFDLDDMICFLLEVQRLNTQNARILEMQAFFQKKVLKLTGVDVNTHLNQHEEKLDKIIDLYE